MDYFSPPVINFATLDQPATMRALDKACREWGLFQLVGHDISTHWRTEVLQVMANLGASQGQTDRCFRPDHTAATEGYLGINPHTDAGALTLLLQDDHAGLEIFRDKHWRRVAGGDYGDYGGEVQIRHYRVAGS